jgi:hypothetical protein
VEIHELHSNRRPLRSIPEGDGGRDSAESIQLKGLGTGLGVSDSGFVTQKTSIDIALFKREYRKFSGSREFFWAFRFIRPIRAIRVKNHHFDLTTTKDYNAGRVKLKYDPALYIHFRKEEFGMINIRRIKPEEALAAKRVIYRVAHAVFNDAR